MSMASYNLLKAAADGLADAINYRTNLKRKRRENEYDYQRDLQRQRDEEAYNHQRDLQWDEEAYKIKRGRAKQEHQEKVQGMHDFLNNRYYGKELNTPQQIQDFNFEAIADDQPFSVALPKKDNIEAQKDLALFKHGLAVDLEKLKAANKGKGGSGRQPSLTPYEKLQHDLSMARTPEEREMILQLHRVAPRAVKGGSGKGAILERSGNVYTDKGLNEIKNQIIDLGKAIDKAKLDNQIDMNKLMEEHNAILSNKSLTDEQKKAELAKIAIRTEAIRDEFNKSINNMTSQMEALNANYADAVNFMYPDYTASGTRILTTSADVANNKDVFANNPALLDAEGRFPDLKGEKTASSTLYTENPLSMEKIDLTPEVMPSDIPQIPILPSDIPPVSIMPEHNVATTTPFIASPTSSIPPSVVPMSDFDRLLQSKTFSIGDAYDFTKKSIADYIDRNEKSYAQNKKQEALNNPGKVQLDALYNQGLISRGAYLKKLKEINSRGGR